MSPLKLGKWAEFEARGPFCASSWPGYAGISGGRTSAMMAALLPQSAFLVFCNTGCEHPKTYDFLEQLDEALGRRIVWLEWRPPPVKGDRPREFRYEVVTYKTAARRGEPFEGFLQALAEYRAAKGEPSLAPYPRMRICTDKMKIKPREKYAREHTGEVFDSYVGLRADEPHRVHRLGAVDTQAKTHRCPLYGAAITKADVMEFWAAQSFDLEIEEHQGNCTGCFLKDQSDLARVLGEPETNADLWIRMERRYENFGGVLFAGYEQLLKERRHRLLIEDGLRRGATRKAMVEALVPTWLLEGIGNENRLKLVVAQEDRRLKVGAEAFSCACEASNLSDPDDAQGELWPT